MNPTNGSAPQGFTPGNGQMPGGGIPNGMGPRGGGALFGPTGGFVGIALLVLTYVVLAIAFWRFLSKAGLTPVIALLMLVPVVNVGVALWAAFTEWPALKEVSRLREQVATYELRAAQSGSAASTDAPSPAASSQAAPA